MFTDDPYKIQCINDPKKRLSPSRSLSLCVSGSVYSIHNGIVICYRLFSQLRKNNGIKVDLRIFVLINSVFPYTYEQVQIRVLFTFTKLR